MDNHWNDKIKYGMLLKSIFFDLESKSISKNNITEEQKKEFYTQTQLLRNVGINPINIWENFQEKYDFQHYQIENFWDIISSKIDTINTIIRIKK